jgi:hypothetical protein
MKAQKNFVLVAMALLFLGSGVSLAAEDLATARDADQAVGGADQVVTSASVSPLALLLSLMSAQELQETLINNKSSLALGDSVDPGDSIDPGAGADCTPVECLACHPLACYNSSTGCRCH